MKIMLINAKETYGGAEVQIKREKTLLESNGHEILLVTLDENLQNGWLNSKKTHYNISIKYRLSICEYYFIYFKDTKIVNAIRLLLREFEPLIIHLNELGRKTISVLNAVSKYKLIQTVRDYPIVCPVGHCIDKNNVVCQGMNYAKCFKKCRTNIFTHNLDLLLRIMYRRKANKLSRKYIKTFICPSQTLTDYCIRHCFNTVCLNNPFDFNLLKDFQKTEQAEVKEFLYYGVISRNKGVAQLVKAFTVFAKNRNVKLYLAGRIHESFRVEFEQYTDYDCVEYAGLVPYSEIIALLKRVQVVVVPSLQMENYPNTALEGIATLNIVLGSNRGGMQEIIQNEDYIFDILNEEDIIAKLERVYSQSIQERNLITATNYKRIYDNNSMAKYYDGLMKIIEYSCNTK
jgi:glycosyltransferase involved in cell wall biosynthesis